MRYIFNCSEDDLHTLATPLGYAIENLMQEEKKARKRSMALAQYKQKCRKDCESMLFRINSMLGINPDVTNIP